MRHVRAAVQVTREHALNRDSSRSHTVCIVQLSVQKDPWLPKVHVAKCLHVREPAYYEVFVRPTVKYSQKPSLAVAVQVVKSLLTFVDLAGSERVMKTRSDGVVLKEAGYINKSLTFLEQVAIAISEGRQHIPYRCDFCISKASSHHIARSQKPSLRHFAAPCFVISSSSPACSSDLPS